jgi:beta-N-acetylhexosaminidase
VLVTAKHFPGHGDTSVDSHIGLAALEADRERIESIELAPFRAAVQAGVDSIMTAHMAVPAYEPEAIPATVSKNILTGLIRDQLRFRGLIVTDAMDMQGLAKQFSAGEAAVRALEAGVDVLLMPADPDAVVKAVLAAVRGKRLSEKRINESVMRILTAKAQVGLHQKKLVDTEEIEDTIESPELAALAQRAADRAVTLVKNNRSVIPVRNPEGACYWILAESRYGQAGRRFLDDIRGRVKNARAVLLDPQVPQIEIDDLLGRFSGCEANVVAAFASVGAYRGTVGLSSAYSSLMDALRKTSMPVVLISLGNPYLLQYFPDVDAYIATFSPVPTSESAAVRALFGDIPFSGRLPVSIPGIAKAGESIRTADAR